MIVYYQVVKFEHFNLDGLLHKHILKICMKQNERIIKTGDYYEI